jgi:hypothetical protein
MTVTRSLASERTQVNEVSAASKGMTNLRRLARLLPNLDRYTMKPTVNCEGETNGKSNQRASAASCGAARSAVARGEVGSSNFRDRVLERPRSIPQVNPTDPSRVGSFTAQNGASAEKAMGKGWQRIAASSSENDGSGSGKAHHVDVRPEEDRGGTKGAMGQGEGSEGPLTHLGW